MGLKIKTLPESKDALINRLYEEDIGLQIIIKKGVIIK